MHFSSRAFVVRVFFIETARGSFTLVSERVKAWALKTQR